jgi:hypothetical protein
VLAHSGGFVVGVAMKSNLGVTVLFIGTALWFLGVAWIIFRGLSELFLRYAR